MRSTVLMALVAAIALVQGTTANKYVVNESVGKAYKLMYKSLVWSQAKEACESMCVKLAVPKSQEEFQFIQALVRGMYYPNITDTTYKLLVWVGINNLDNYRVWKNLEGEDIKDTGFHTWSGDNGNSFSGNPAEPHCAGMDAANPGLRSWWCHRRQPYICEKTVA